MIEKTRLLAPLGWMGLIWFFSSIPAAPDQTMAGIFIPKALQKGLHVVVYAILCGLWLWVMDRGRLTSVGAASAVGLATAYAAADEFHQTFTPGRFGSPADVALDAVAAALAVVVVVAVREAVGCHG